MTVPDDTKIIDIFNPPELHILTGTVGKIVKEIERNAFETAEEGKTLMDAWLKEEDIKDIKDQHHLKASRLRSFCSVCTAWSMLL